MRRRDARCNSPGSDPGDAAQDVAAQSAGRRVNGAQNPLALWPASASANAVEVDYIILAFTAVTLLLTVPIFVGITWFAFRYRRGKPADRSNPESRSVLIELSWMIIPFALTLIFFAWAARVYDREVHAPPGTLDIEAIGRQWMWKFQHPGGQAEINDLHVPVGQPVMIRMIAQDVIHALYIPALRIQIDALPDRYTSLWFNADRPGVYHLFCSEYCGTDHSIMAGLLTIMEPAAYQDWLGHSGSDQSLGAAGKRLFSSYGCSGCHGSNSTTRAPSLAGLYGRPVPMEIGGTTTADDSYIRDKILMPDEHLVAGYKQVMPSFKGKMPEDDLVRLIAYVKSLGESADRRPGAQPQ